MNALEAALKIADAEINRIHQQELRGGYAIAPVDPRARNVGARMDAGRALGPAEYGILRQGIPEAILDLIGRHAELLLLKRRAKSLRS